MRRKDRGAHHCTKLSTYGTIVSLHQKLHASCTAPGHATTPAAPFAVATLQTMALRSAAAGLLLLAAFFVTLLVGNAEAADLGTPHATVVKLRTKDFDDHLKDPANGLWLLKFYAPW